MAESLDGLKTMVFPMETSETVCDRLKIYKKSGKESEEVKSTRKLLEGIKLRRDERAKELARRRGLDVSSSDVDMPENKDEVDKDGAKPMSQEEQVEERQTEEDEMQELGDDEDTYSQRNLQSQAKLLYSENEEDLLPPVAYFRKFMSKSMYPPISSFMELNILPRFVQLLSIAKDPKLHYEAAWLVTNIANGASEYTQKVVDAGAVPALIELLSVKDHSTAEQALWALGNIAGDCTELRDYVLDHGIVPAILKFAEDPEQLPESFVEILSWVISNLARFKPHCDVQKLTPLGDIMKKVLATEGSRNSHIDLCWALSFMSDGNNDGGIQAVIDLALVPKLLELLDHNDYRISMPILRTFGNMAAGTDNQTQVVVDSGVLARLDPFTHSPRDAIKREVFWMISNILSGTYQQIQSVIDCGLIPPVVQYLSEGSYKVQKECCLCLCNLLTSGNLHQQRFATTVENLGALCAFLVNKDENIIVCILVALECVLKAGVGQMVDAAIERVGGVEKFEHFKVHSNEHIKELYQSVCSLCEADVS